jgi:hypothetical protein
MNGVPAMSLQPETTHPSAIHLQRLRRQLCLKILLAGVPASKFLRGHGDWFMPGFSFESGRATAYMSQLICFSSPYGLSSIL